MNERFWDLDHTMVPNSNVQLWLNALQKIGKELSNDVNLPLDILEACLSKVGQSPSRFIQRILSLINESLSQPRLLRHHDKEIKLAATTCLREILRR